MNQLQNLKTKTRTIAICNRETHLLQKVVHCPEYQALIYKDQGHIHSHNQHGLCMPQSGVIRGPPAKEREHQNGNGKETDERKLQVPSLILSGQSEILSKILSNDFIFKASKLAIEFSSVSEDNSLR